MLELGDCLVHLGAHRLPVLDRSSDVAEDALEVGAEPFECVGIGDPVDLDVDQRLRLSALAADLEQPALLVAAQAHDRLRDEMHGAAVPGHLHLVAESARAAFMANTVSCNTTASCRPCSSTFGL